MRYVVHLGQAGDRVNPEQGLVSAARNLRNMVQGLPRPSIVVPFLVVLIRILTKEPYQTRKGTTKYRVQGILLRNSYYTNTDVRIESLPPPGLEPKSSCLSFWAPTDCVYDYAGYIHPKVTLQNSREVRHKLWYRS